MSILFLKYCESFLQLQAASDQSFSVRFQLNEFRRSWIPTGMQVVVRWWKAGSLKSPDFRSCEPHQLISRLEPFGRTLLTSTHNSSVVEWDFHSAGTDLLWVLWSGLKSMFQNWLWLATFLFPWTLLSACLFKVPFAFLQRKIESFDMLWLDVNKCIPA